MNNQFNKHFVFNDQQTQNSLFLSQNVFEIGNNEQTFGNDREVHMGNLESTTKTIEMVRETEDVVESKMVSYLEHIPSKEFQNPRKQISFNIYRQS